MLDIAFIREHKDIVAAGAKKKRIDFDVDELIAVDDKRRALLGEVEEMRARQNKAAAAVASAGEESREDLIAQSRSLKEELRKKEEELKDVMARWRALMVRVPNIPDVSVPEGGSDADNVPVKEWGEKPVFSFSPRSHTDIMRSLGMADFQRGVKISGFRGYILAGDGALLATAVWEAAKAHFLKKGFRPLLVPSMVRKETLIGTGYLPDGEEDLYRTQDGDFLSGTAEVATMAMHMDETLSEEELPKKYLAFSPCFRREAGSHGKDTKGLVRVHEFFKWEQVVLCEASHETSVRLHEEINRNTEEFIESLGIPYRTVVNCGGDLGLGQVKKYDIELWMPSEEKYREISSASYFHDFQTRRLNIKYRGKDGKTRFAHSLNGTAIPTPRILAALTENFQREDGSVDVPEILRPFLGKGRIERSA